VNNRAHGWIRTTVHHKPRLELTCEQSLSTRKAIDGLPAPLSYTRVACPL